MHISLYNKPCALVLETGESRGAMCRTMLNEEHLFGLCLCFERQV